MPASNVPDRGDLAWLEFTPQAGSEQKTGPDHITKDV